MTITIKGEGLKVLNEFVYMGVSDPDTMADVLAYDVDDFTNGITQLAISVNESRGLECVSSI